MTDSRSLDEMGPEELGRLFPITLADHDASWAAAYRREADRLEPVLRPYGGCLHHVGSSAIPGIMAKPTVDMLAEVESGYDEEALIAGVTAAGYHYTPQRGHAQKVHLMFVKGYSSAGLAPLAFHLHVRLYGDRDEILFRDYLRAHPAACREYQTLKAALAQEFRYDREGYTAGKTAFVEQIVARARRQSMDEGERT